MDDLVLPTGPVPAHVLRLELVMLGLLGVADEVLGLQSLATGSIGAAAVLSFVCADVVVGLVLWAWRRL